MAEDKKNRFDWKIVGFDDDFFGENEKILNRKREERRKEEEAARIANGRGTPQGRDDDHSKSPKANPSKKTRNRQRVGATSPKLRSKKPVSRMPHVSGKAVAWSGAVTAFVLALAIFVAGRGAQELDTPGGIDMSGIAESVVESSIDDGSWDMGGVTQAPEETSYAEEKPSAERIRQEKLEQLQEKYKSEDGNTKTIFFNDLKKEYVCLNEDYAMYVASVAMNEVIQDLEEKLQSAREGSYEYRAYKLMMDAIDEGAVSPLTVLAHTKVESDYRMRDVDGNILTNQQGAQSIVQNYAPARADVKQWLGYSGTTEQYANDPYLAFKMGIGYDLVNAVYLGSYMGRDNWKNLSVDQKKQAVWGAYKEGAKDYYQLYYQTGKKLPYIDAASTQLDRILGKTNLVNIVKTVYNPYNDGYASSIDGTSASY